MRQRSDPIAHSGGQGSSAAARVVKSQLVALVANSGGHDSTLIGRLKLNFSEIELLAPICKILVLLSKIFLFKINFSLQN